MERNKMSLEVFRRRDEGLENIENLPGPDVLAGKSVDNLHAAMEQFEGILEDLGGEQASMG